MSTRTIILCTILLVIVSSPARATDLPYEPGELIVRFAPKANGQQRTKAEKEQLMASLGGGSVSHSYWLVPGLTLINLPENLTKYQVFS